MDRIKKILGVTYPIIASCLAVLAIFTLSRIALSLWMYPRFHGLSDWVHVFVSGLRVDIASICFLFILPALLTTLLSSDSVVGRLWHIVLRLWITAGLWFVVYMEVATPPFVMEYDLRPNRLFIEYLIYPKEVFSMLWTGYKLELFIGLVTSILAVRFDWKWSKKLTQNLSFPKWYWRPVLAVLVVAIGFLGARSTLGHRPLNPSMVAFSPDPMLNDLTLNSAYSVLYAANQMGSDVSAFNYYPKMKKDEIINIVRNSMQPPTTSFDDPKSPAATYHEATQKSPYKNIVILLLESHGARYVKSLGGLPLSPSIDKLMDEGWGFTNMYASGTRSVRGIEAVVTGFTPTPARSVVKLAKSQNHFFTIAELLKSYGYHTQFIYGGESHFDNMKGFFLGNGFVDMQDFPTFDHPNFVGSWGASDGDLYQKADQQFTKLHQSGKPFFSLVFSSSNHTPFEFPDSRIKLYNQPKQTRENAVKYADFELGEFVKKAKQSEYWKDTVFVAIADHDSRSKGVLPVPIDHFHIPAVIFGGPVKHKKDNRLVSQIDIPPTLLSLAGISSSDPMIGFDLTKPVSKSLQRAIMQRGENFGWMTANNDVVVIRPEQGISTYHYNQDENTLTDAEVPEDIVRKANANALWGSLAFKENYYRTQ